ncbi:MAG: alpha/beta hydrolase [Caballeronia sp.]|jgi:pimeloyl-ACP methyl ester carboxylesterase|uniref:alpha/beta fold hydrolase n=1 Tax=Caballeronia sp. TaxID=1931223 RepID=UPI00261ADC74|nr:alpha/beta hydrolase [Caballeronia sp.]MDB5834798.1 alpha/beta hydrolase [Caballeronia sp.]
MRHLQAVVVVIACALALLSAPALAHDLQFPAENACPEVAHRPDRDPALRQQIAHTASGDIAYYRFGHGSPVVLQTGYRATVAEWDVAFLAALGEKHDVIVFDNRGIGRSQPEAVSFTVEDMAGDAAALIDALHLRDVTVIGWSMGGAIVQQLAIGRPAALRRIVLMNAPAPGRLGVPVPPEIAAVLSGEPGTTFTSVMRVLFPPVALNAAQRCFRANMFSPADYGSPKITATVTQGQSALLRDWAGDDATEVALKAVQADTLIVGGADDVVLPPQNSDALARLIAGARLWVVASAGHAMMYQYPDALAALIDGFIEQTARNSGGNSGRNSMPGAALMKLRATPLAVDARGHQRAQ